jgi:hypothetical protein
MAGDVPQLVLWAVGVLASLAFANTAFLAGIFSRLGRIAGDLEQGSKVMADHETRLRNLEGMRHAMDC